MTDTTRKISVGYAYTLSGEAEIDLSDYEQFCVDNSRVAYGEDGLNADSLKEFLLENVDLVELANDGDLYLVDGLKI